MEVQFISSRSFPGWDKFRAQLGSVAPEEALAAVQVFTRLIAKRDEGAFRGQPPVFPITLHVVEREWVQRLSVGTLPKLNPDTRDACMRVVLDACREVNGLREQHEALQRSPLLLPAELKAQERLRVLWFHHLEQQGMNWAAKLELGRSQRMFAEIWPAMYKDGRIKLRSSEETAFLSTRYALLLAIGIWHAQGNVADARELFKEAALSESTLGNVLDAIAVPLEEVQKDLASAAVYPDSIQNYFQRYPLIRVGTWGAFAPLPDLLLQSWDLRNLFDNLELTLMNVGHRGGAEFYRALGVVFEDYARELLGELAAHCAATYIPEFRHDGSLDSPDAFLVNGSAKFAFEMKCYRVPRSAYDNVTLGSFESWFASLLGTNDKGRAPLAQGASFFKKWEAGNPEIKAKVGEVSRDTQYFIVSYEDVPAFCSWNVFREWYATEHLDDSTRGLWARTTVISIRELESLVSAARGYQERTGAPFDLVATLAKYHEYRKEAPDADHDPVNGFKDGLGNWVLRTQEHARDSEPAVLAEARRRLFQEALEAGFPATL